MFGEGVVVGNNGVSFSHIQFADDTILFGKATESNLWAAKSILRTFELVSGLKNVGWGNHIRLSFWQPLVDSIKKKLSAPKSVVKTIEKIRKNFLWGGCEETRKVHWVSWEKWWGKLAKGEVGLWGSLIREKYGNGNDNWMSYVKDGRGKGSSWWKDVCRIDVLGENRNGWLSNGFEIIIGDGEEVSFWWDSWSKEGVLAHRFASLYMLSVGMDYKIKQMGVCIGDKCAGRYHGDGIPSKREIRKDQDIPILLPQRRRVISMSLEEYGIQMPQQSHDGIAVSKQMRIGWEVVWFALDPDTHEDFRPTNKLQGSTVSLKDVVEQDVKENPVMIYMKGVPEFPQCGFSLLASGEPKEKLKDIGANQKAE
ncbi:hypothetical protein SLEP1_g37273 [Rubroshorea leprosula]|uniref:Uncharacterized protein n=1 Tax=Rubroshorea leprosula TaxID=152421 RepID=A0AAV5KU17_9ROSI|nr:hypothetical protein SLEP1_g37273 [Rubroshorea leprosula]